MTRIMNSKYQLFDMVIRATLDSVCLSGLTPSDLVVLTREIHAYLCSHMHRRDIPNVTVLSETAILFCACSRLILCFCMCVSVYTMASEELRLWRQSPAHIFAGLNLSGCTLYKHNKAPLHRGFCYMWLNVYV